MKFPDLFALTIRSLDVNLLPQHPELVKQLRKLTLHSYSGLNRELNLLFNLMSQSEPKSCWHIITGF